jgi:hypothetical protein
MSTQLEPVELRAQIINAVCQKLRELRQIQGMLKYWKMTQEDQLKLILQAKRIIAELEA